MTWTPQADAPARHLSPRPEATGPQPRFSPRGQASNGAVGDGFRFRCVGALAIEPEESEASREEPTR